MSLDMHSRDTVDVAIIGAGAAGLSLARILERHGIRYRLLERRRTAASWFAMPSKLRLTSPWWTNVLDTRDLFRHFPFARVNAEDFARYLVMFRERHGIVVTEHCEVLAIGCAENGRFALETSAGTLEARVTVCSTGYFSRPARPDPAYDSDGSVPAFHAALCPSAERVRSLAAGKPVVIVGKRVSAGQLMVELHDHGVDVALSTKSEIKFRRDGLLAALKEHAYYFYEELLIMRSPHLKQCSYPDMDGGRARLLYEAGHIHAFPTIRRVRDGRVEFVDGRSLWTGQPFVDTRAPIHGNHRGVYGQQQAVHGRVPQ